MRRIEGLRLAFIKLVGDVGLMGLMGFGSDWVGVVGRVLLNTSVFYSVKDFQNTVVLQWFSRKLCFVEVTFAVQCLYCKASADGARPDC